MTETQNFKQYDLENRTFEFAKDCRLFIKRLPKTVGNYEDAPQLIRSSGSVGANYIEANDAISRKDFTHRVKICRKEAKESVYWLRLVDIKDDATLDQVRNDLIQEGTELMKIFGSIVRKSE